MIYIYYYFQVITIRNPFSRLLSAFNDKFRSSAQGSFYNGIGRKIEKKYRRFRHKFEERNKVYEIPLFEDFINFVVYDKGTVDHHWIPFYQLCYPCNVHFDVIIKFETLYADIGNLTNLLGISPQHKVAVFPNLPFKTTEQKVKAAFANLPKRLIYLLYDKFRIDFEIFGYKRPDWLP